MAGDAAPACALPPPIPMPPPDALDPEAPPIAADAPTPAPGVGPVSRVDETAHGRHGHEQRAKGLRIGAIVGRQPDVDGEPCAPGDGGRDGHAANGGLDHVLHVADGQAVAGNRVAVRRDVDVLAARLALGERAARPGHLAQHAFEAHAEALDLGQIVAEHLDADGRPHAGRQHVDAGPDRRSDGHLVARHPQRAVQVPGELRQCARLLFGPDPSQHRLLGPVRRVRRCTSAPCSASATARAA